MNELNFDIQDYATIERYEADMQEQYEEVEYLCDCGFHILPVTILYSEVNE